MKQAQKGADVRKNILIAFACITVLAILAYVGNQYFLRKNGFSPTALSAAQLETGAEGRVQLTLDALQGPFAAQEPDLYYYFFLPHDGEEGRIAVIALRESQQNEDLPALLEQSQNAGDPESQRVTLEVTGTLEQIPPSLRETLKTQLDAWLDEGEVTDEDLSALFYPYYVSESSVDAPATDILYYVLFGGLYLAWFVYAWVALENVQKEET